MQNVPYGFCHCGCGEKTNIARRSMTSKGWVKGQPLRYITGHRSRLSPHEYLVNSVTGCWEWQRHISRYGYGRTKSDGKGQPAHRVYYERHVGPIPEGLQLDHLCRNRACVNPDHLEPVTNAENVQRSRTAKLSWENVRAIRARSEPNTKLAPIYGVTHSCIADIRTGKTWRDDPLSGVPFVVEGRTR